MGPFCVNRSNPTHQLTDPPQPNPLQVEKFGPDPTQSNTTNNGVYSLVVTYFLYTDLSRTFSQPSINLFMLMLGSILIIIHIKTVSLFHSKTSSSAVKSNLTAGYNQILSNRALNALT